MVGTCGCEQSSGLAWSVQYIFRSGLLYLLEVLWASVWEMHENSLLPLCNWLDEYTFFLPSGYWQGLLVWSRSYIESTWPRLRVLCIQKYVYWNPVHLWHVWVRGKNFRLTICRYFKNADIYPSKMLKLRIFTKLSAFLIIDTIIQFYGKEVKKCR